VGGLCDLFGIKPDKHIKRVCQAEYNGRTEYITPFDAEFHAVPDGGEVVMTADGEPVIIRKGRNIYINAPVSEIGRESFFERIQFSEYTISELLKEAVGDVICELSEPAATAENAGITLYEGSDGIKRVLLVSYALESKNVTVTFHDEVMNCEIIASCDDMEINRFREGDRIAVAELMIPTKGWALLKIE